MKTAPPLAALIAAALLAGCASARIGLDSSAPPGMRGGAPAPGTSYSAAVFGADVGADPLIGLLFLGLFAASFGDASPESRTAPPLAEDRAIAERDCSRPLDAPSANLRCKRVLP